MASDLHVSISNCALDADLTIGTYVFSPGYCLCSRMRVPNVFSSFSLATDLDLFSCDPPRWQMSLRCAKASLQLRSFAWLGHPMCLCFGSGIPGCNVGGMSFGIVAFQFLDDECAFCADLLQDRTLSRSSSTCFACRCPQSVYFDQRFYFETMGRQQEHNIVEGTSDLFQY